MTERDKPYLEVWWRFTATHQDGRVQYRRTPAVVVEDLRLSADALQTRQLDLQERLSERDS